MNLDFALSPDHDAIHVRVGVASDVILSFRHRGP
jgi:hypothetical protein